MSKFFNGLYIIALILFVLGCSADSLHKLPKSPDSANSISQEPENRSLIDGQKQNYQTNTYVRKNESSRSVPAEFLVKFKNGVSRSARAEALAGVRASKVHHYEDKNFSRGRKKGHAFFDELVHVRLENPQNEDDVLASLRGNPKVEYAEPNYYVQVFETVPNDTLFDQLWGIDKIDAPLAWDIEKGSRQVVVGIIDTGIDYTHPDLGENIWVNSDEIPGNGIDDDGNGYDDDFYGYDFCNDDSDPKDDHKHGTHVAGTIGALADNAQGVAGINWEVRMMAVKFASSEGSGEVDDAIRSIQYAVNNGAHVLNNSWGGDGYSQALQDTINVAHEAGVLFVASAGNNNTSAPAYPAAMENVLTVSATDQNDEKAYFSNYGSHVDVAAPGVSILSSALGHGYELLSGTSMSCPHVVGLAALIKARNFDLTCDDIRAVIENSTDDIGAAGKDEYFGFGRINAFNALSIVDNGFSDFPTLAITSPATGIKINQSFDVAGVAFGSSLAGWRLEYSEPQGTQWIVLNESTVAVPEEQVLGHIEPLIDWQDGWLGIRLVAIDAYGNEFKSAIALYYATTQIEKPYPYGELVAGEQAEIIGTSGGPGFISYTLEYGLGFDPTSWTQIATSSVPVAGGVLANFDVPPQAWGYATLRMRCLLASGERTVRFPVYIEQNNFNGWPVVADMSTYWNFYGYGDDLVLYDFADEKRLITPVGFHYGIAVVNPVVNHWMDIEQYVADGSRVAGWPPTFFEEFGVLSSAPAIGDVDNDGVNEIAFTSRVYKPGGLDYHLYVLEADGSLIFKRILGAPEGSYSVGQPAATLEDLDGDGYLDVIAPGTSESGSVHAYDRFGNELSGFPIRVPDAVADQRGWPSGISTGDLDGDGMPELVFWVATQDERFHLYIYRSDGSAYPMSHSIVTEPLLHLFYVPPPVLGDIDGDGDLEIVAWNLYTNLGVYRPDGSALSGWPIQEGVMSGIALGDLDDDGKPEIVTHSDGMLKAFAGNGTFFNNWQPDYSPTRSKAKRSTPLIADINGDGEVEILYKSKRIINTSPEWHLTGSQSKIYFVELDARDASNNEVEGFPKQISIPDTDYSVFHDGSPALGDIDGDGNLDMFAASDQVLMTLDNIKRAPGRIKAWPLGIPEEEARIEWGYARGDIRNTGRYSPKLPQTVDPDITPPVVVSTIPASGASNASVNTVIQVRFSEAIEESSLTGKVVVRLGGNVVPGNLTLLNGNVALFEPGSILNYESNYTVTVEAGITDLSGNALVSDYVFSFTTQAQPDVTPPTVVSTNPSNGAVNVPVDTTIRIVFSEEVDQNLLAGNIILTQDGNVVPGSVALSGGNIAVFTPAGNLAYESVHTVTVAGGAGGVKDLSGNPLASDYIFSFTTEVEPDLTPPQVISTDPSNGDVGVSINASIEVVFSENIDGNSVAGNVVVRKDSVVVSGGLELSGNVVTFTPSGNLIYGSGYTVTVVGGSQGIKDLSENPLLSDYVFSFVTEIEPDVTPPQVIDTGPANGANDVSVNTIVAVTFSEDISPNSLSGNIVVKRGSNVVTGSLTLVSGNIAMFTPSSSLMYDSLYTVTAEGGPQGIEDLSGNHLAHDYIFSFTTEAEPDLIAPVVVSTVPTNGSVNVSINTDVKVRFSEAVDHSSLANNIILKRGGSSVGGSITLSGDGTLATFTPFGSLSYASLYTVTAVGGAQGIKDLSGNALASDHVFSFMTDVEPDLIAPSIISTVPQSGGVNVSINTDVKVRFSEAVDQSSLANNIILKRGGGSVGGSITLSGDGTLATFTPFGSLSYASLYTVTAVGGAQGIKDLSGNALSSNYEFSFITELEPDVLPPEISSTDPSDGDVGVPIGEAIRITFSEAIDDNSLTNNVMVSGNGIVVDGQLNLTGNVVIFTPLSNFGYGTVYTVRVIGGAQGIKDLNGNYLLSDYVLSFVTEVEPDLAPPDIENPHPTTPLPAGTTQTLISVETSEPASCRYSGSPGTVFESMEGQMENDVGRQYHFATVDGLSSGNTYDFYLRCIDDAGNTNGGDFIITVQVENEVVSPPLPTPTPGPTPIINPQIPDVPTDVPTTVSGGCGVVSSGFDQEPGLFGIFSLLSLLTLLCVFRKDPT